MIETQLGTKEVGPSSFIALVNFALLYPIDADQAELAAKALKQTDYHLRNIEKKSQIVVILFGLAKVAAVSRNHRLADELRILVRRYRHDTEYALSIEEVIRICLVAAASRSQLDEWTEFVGAWLTELAFGDLKDDEGQIFYSSLNCLCHAVPELWISCGRADAALSAFRYINDTSNQKIRSSLASKGFPSGPCPKCLTIYFITGFICASSANICEYLRINPYHPTLHFTQHTE